MSSATASAWPSPPSAPPETAVAWFCLRSQVKHEHIAAAHLRKLNIEVLNPRIRFKRLTKYGVAPVTEAMFPGYLFARFDLRTCLPRVQYAPGVKHVVHFGARWPKVPDAVIEDIRRRLGHEELHEVPDELVPGQTVQIAVGAFHGLEAVISQVLPGRQRVLVLLDFLGRQATVELETNNVVRKNLCG
jgi:transcriptional antiterminator RfaH